MTADEGEAQATLNSTRGVADQVRDNAVYVRIAKYGEDVEIGALNHCVSVLSQLKPEEAARAAKYLAVRFT